MKKKKIVNGLIISRSGNKYWYKNNKLHNTKGPAKITKYCRYWYFNGKLHRVGGPAIEWFCGSKWWYLNGQRHREDGPAIEDANGYKGWYYQDQYVDCESQEEFEFWKKSLKFKAFW